MLACAQTFTIQGLEIRSVTVEVDIRPGLPSFTVVGLADASVREARERVRAAIVNSGYEFPGRRITANLAPADVPKAGPGLDLALACAVLAGSGQLPREQLEGTTLFAELALDGRLRPCAGTLAVAQASLATGLTTLLLAPELAREATHVAGLTVRVAARLPGALRVLAGGPGDPLPARQAPVGAAGRGRDLADVRGQSHAVRALTIAAAGGHNLLLSGAPGSGKTMLAQRLGSILPPLSRSEAIEVTRIHSIAGLHEGGALIERRPFRAPHHTITTAGMVGGGRAGRVGEIVLAHLGVLMLDELSEFSRETLDALRQPLEDGRVAIVRAHCSFVHPARFTLVATTNPCSCGHHGLSERCSCTPGELARHRRRLSGPLLDRLDLVIHMEPSHGHPGSGHPQTRATVSSATAQALVTAARERQAQRLRGQPVTANAEIDDWTLERHLQLDGRAGRLLAEAERRGRLSARGTGRVLRVARTIADLDASRRVRDEHLAEALCLRIAGDLAARAA